MCERIINTSNFKNQKKKDKEIKVFVHPHEKKESFKDESLE